MFLRRKSDSKRSHGVQPTQAGLGARVERSDRPRGPLTASALAVAAVLSVIIVPSAGAQDCTGTVSASVAAASLPGGSWAVESGCLTADSFYEFSDGPVLAKVGISEATYTDGHTGRVAAGVLTLGNDVGLAIVGVEDPATGVVKFSAVLGDFTAEGDSVSVQGEGVALLPIESATVSATLTGTGTDVSSMIEGAVTTQPTPEAPAPVEPIEVPGTPQAEPASPTTVVVEETVPDSPVATEPAAPAQPTPETLPSEASG